MKPNIPRIKVPERNNRENTFLHLFWWEEGVRKDLSKKRFKNISPY